VDVFSGGLIDGDIAIVNGTIAGVGSYSGEKEIDGEGMYAAPGLIDSHIHIESSYLTPEEFGRIALPHGTTTVIADPHEIVNVCGLEGLRYMQRAAEKTAMDIRYAMPSCVPATPFEHAGANIGADEMAEPLKEEGIASLGEFMNFVGVVNNDEDCLRKILAAKEAGKIIDGHSPNLDSKELNAYSAVGIRNDHECSTLKEMEDRISRGMYVIMRQGSACQDLDTLIAGVTPVNERRMLLCSDDRQAETLFTQGHMEEHLRKCVKAGLSAVSAIRMASLNASECFQLQDRGAIAPGRRADIVIFEDLVDFKPVKVFVQGVLAAEDGQYLLPFERADTSSVIGSFHVKDFSPERLKLKLGSNRVNTIGIIPGGVVTEKKVMDISLSSDGDFAYDSDIDVVKVAVVERHHETGNVGVGLLSGYGMQCGAIAVSIAHDSHNIIVAGVSNDEMAAAAEAIIRQGGGMVLVKDGKVLDSIPMPVAGIMCDQSGEWVAEHLRSFHNTAWKELGISRDVEPVMTLTFMALPVIPELKLTDMGLFDVMAFRFIEVEA
ncbi:MAG: adenine deaminase, partial [Lachnospiraceae bacterium]|nr:adenine deaminase [Lachnospiraceae bacterium]